MSEKRKANILKQGKAFKINKRPSKAVLEANQEKMRQLQERVAREHLSAIVIDNFGRPVGEMEWKHDGTNEPVVSGDGTAVPAVGNMYPGGSSDDVQAESPVLGTDDAA
jgi:hypothetical protein